jgi:toxin ParE1/3/4
VKRFSVHFDRGVAEDIEDIRNFVRLAASQAIADAFVERIVFYCEGLGTTPHRGAVRDEIAPGLRVVGWRKTVSIAFQVDESVGRVLVLGVLYRGRDVAAAMTQRQKREQD